MHTNSGAGRPFKIVFFPKHKGCQAFSRPEQAALTHVLMRVFTYVITRQPSQISLISNTKRLTTNIIRKESRAGGIGILNRQPRENFTHYA
jgi:hypothetical protein